MQLRDQAIYASLGQPFMRTFYTQLNYGQNVVLFGVSTTVSVQGEMHLFPPILIMYLGLTIVIIPPIIAALCMEYHYCPKRRQTQQTNRIKRLLKARKN
jgi:hypothetical protein